MHNDIRHWYRDFQWLAALCLGGFLSLGAGTLTAITSNFSPIYAANDSGVIGGIIFLLAYPILEEFVFRGLVQPIFLRHWPRSFQGISLANMLTSGLFTLAHTASKGLHWFTLGVFIPSLVFGYFRDRHQSIISATILHCAYNLCFFVPFLLFG